jgi:HAD superfamily hydrolase (TIGR01509 family)
LTFTGVIFDLDGTLLDTEALALQTGQTAFDAVGISNYEGILHSLVGMDFVTGAELLRNAYPDADHDRLHQIWRQESKALHLNGVPLKPGVIELLDLLQERDLPWAIATSSFLTSAQRKLDSAGLLDRVSHLVTRDDVTNPKPHPEPFLMASGLIDQPPAQCLAFEDSELGAQSAKAAGMRVVQVKDIIPPSGNHAHYVADSLLDGARKAGLV